jgi:hypothetical protein
MAKNLFASRNRERKASMASYLVKIKGHLTGKRPLRKGLEYRTYEIESPNPDMVGKLAIRRAYEDGGIQCIDVISIKRLRKSLEPLEPVG